MTVLDRLRAIREGVPQPVEHKNVRCPEEVPGWDDWLLFGRNTWRELGRGVWTDGIHVLFWTPCHGDDGTLLWGSEAQVIVDRYTNFRPADAATSPGMAQ